MKTSLKGRYKLEIVNHETGAVREYDWQDNLITNFGLEHLVTSTAETSEFWAGYCSVGSGTTAPVVTDTSMEDLIAGAIIAPEPGITRSTVRTGPTTASGEETYLFASELLFVFPQYTFSNDIARKIGVGATNDGNNLVSIILLNEEIDLAPQEELRVTFRLEQFIDNFMGVYSSIFDFIDFSTYETDSEILIPWYSITGPAIADSVGHIQGDFPLVTIEEALTDASAEAYSNCGFISEFTEPTPINAIEEGATTTATKGGNPTSTSIQVDFEFGGTVANDVDLNGFVFRMGLGTHQAITEDVITKSEGSDLFMTMIYLAERAPAPACYVLSSGSLNAPTLPAEVPADPNTRTINVLVETPKSGRQADIIWSYTDEGDLSPVAGTTTPWAQDAALSPGFVGSDYEARIILQDPGADLWPANIDGDDLDTWLPLSSARSWDFIADWVDDEYQEFTLPVRVEIRTVGNSSCIAQFEGTLESGKAVQVPYLGDALMWLDPTDNATMWQDVAKTTPVTTIGDPVLYWEDKTGNGNDCSIGNIGDAPTWQGDHLQFTSAYMEGPDFSSLTGGTLTMRVETPAPITSQIIGWSHFLGIYNVSNSQASWVTSTVGTYGDHRWGFLSGVRRTASSWAALPFAASDDLVHTETHNGTEGKCYLDNTLIDTQTYAVSAPAITMIGAVRNPSGRMTNGKMYGCLLYDRALDAGEIAEVVDYFNGA